MGVNALARTRVLPGAEEFGAGQGQGLREMALKGLRVVEMAGLAPAPLAGMILAGETQILHF